MKLIITGATGFLGRNLAYHLSRDGYRVLATGRSLKVGDSIKMLGIEFQAADIRDREELIGAFTSADCVIHCAAKSGPWGRYKEFFAANVLGTRNVIAACKHHGIGKIIFISTPSIYFTGKDRYNIHEDDPLPTNPASNYAATKRVCETELLSLQSQGFYTIIFRPRAVFGPYDNAFVPRILRMADKKTIPLINGGNALIDITYIDDFVEVIRLALAAQDVAWNQAYNISSGDPIRVRDWFSWILEIFDKEYKFKVVPESAAKVAATAMEFFSYLPFVNKEPPMTRFTVGYMARSMTMNIGKAKRLLGYQPAVSHRDGFERYAAWIRSRSLNS